MTDTRRIEINVPILARVEGEGALDICIENGRIEQLRLSIFEPPRLFEKLLEGRDCHEVADIVARICGICPVAYQMSAVHALEAIFACEPGPWVRDMRRVLYCGEWLESHSLHIHLLAAPDFLGYRSAPEMAVDFPDEVRRGLRLQAVGNALIQLLGGRSVHPVGVRIGGFYHAPSVEQVKRLLERLHQASVDAEALLKWTLSLDLPDNSQDFCYVAMHHPQEYPINEGRLISSIGLDIASDEFSAHIVEHQVPHSTALHALLDGKPYLVGPLARLNINHQQLPSRINEILREAGFQLPSFNMFHSIVARAAEIYYAVTEAIKLLEHYHLPDSPFVEPQIRGGTGTAFSEAPRGILWHRYQVDEDGKITSATIVPPTSQNQARIEEDLGNSLQSYGLQRDSEDLRNYGEKIIRNYDPCISCSTHFLKMNIQQR